MLYPSLLLHLMLCAYPPDTLPSAPYMLVPPGILLLRKMPLYGTHLLTPTNTLPPIYAHYAHSVCPSSYSPNLYHRAHSPD